VSALRAWHWLVLVAAVPTAVTGAWLLYRFDPNAAGSPFLPCLFRALTGFYCPGCGMTRALHALLHLDLGTALRMNPLVVGGLATVPGLLAWKAGWRARWFAPVVSVMSRPNFWLVLLPAYWLARNLPWFPFTVLAPG
jgi:hypothetical protein